jgi:uncharacterized protein involved in exopolysaccharide biosynthesis
MTNASMENRDGDGLIDPWAIARKLYQRLPLIALIAIVAVGLTAAYVFTAAPVYTAWTRIVVDPASRKPFEDKNAPSLLGSEALGLDTQLLIVSSAAVLEPVVAELKLTEDPEFVKGAAGDAPERRAAKVMAALAKAVTVSREGATYIISIGVKSQSAQKSADLSQAIAKSYLREQQQFQLNSSQQLAEQIDTRLVGLRERVRETEEKVQKFRAEKRLQSGVDGSLLVGQELGGLNAQLVEARSALATATAASEEIQRYFKREIEPTALGEVVNSPRVTQLLQEYSRAVRNEASLAAGLLPQHPSLLRAKAEVARISSLVRAEIQSIGEGKKVELDVAQQRVANLERQMETVRSSSNVGEEDLIMLRELETEAKSTRAVYENVLGRAKEVANLEQITMPVARIISPALPPEDPSWPRKKVLVALAGVVGVALGIFLVVVLEVWRQLRARYSPASVLSESKVEPVETVVVEAAPVEAVQVTETVQPVPRRRIVYTGSPKISTGYPKR